MKQSRIEQKYYQIKIFMSDNQKLEVLCNVINLLCYKHPESQTQLSLLHGAIKQWADSFYEQLIAKNHTIIKNQHYKQILFAVSESIQEIQHFMHGLTQFYNDANLQLYYKQYLGIVTPLIKQLRMNTQYNPEQENKSMNHRAMNGNFVIKKTQQIQRNLSSPRKQWCYEEPNILKQQMLSTPIIFERKSKDVFKNKDLPITFANLQNSLHNKQSLRSATKQLGKNQNKYSNSIKIQSNNKYDIELQNIGIPDFKQPNQPLQYSECLKRLRRQLLNVQKQVPKLKLANKYLQEQVKVLQGKYAQKAKQVLQYEQKLYLSQKKCNKLQFQISQLRQDNDFSSFGSKKPKHNTAKLMNQKSTKLNIFSCMGHSQSTIDIAKENSVMINGKFKNELDFQKTSPIQVGGQEMRMLFLQACTIQQMIRAQDSIKKNEQ